MGERADALAAKVAAANSALRATIEASTPEQWGAGCADGDWTQGFSAYHAAASAGNIAGMVQGMASGAPFEPVTFAEIDEMNAAYHAENANRTKDEALELLAATAPLSESIARGFTDEQLDMQVHLAVGLPPMSVEQVVEMLMIGHAEGHRASIEGAR